MKQVAKILLLLAVITGNILFYTWNADDVPGASGAAYALAEHWLLYVMCQGMFLAAIGALIYFIITKK